MKEVKFIVFHTLLPKLITWSAGYPLTIDDFQLRNKNWVEYMPKTPDVRGVTGHLFTMTGRIEKYKGNNSHLDVFLTVSGELHARIRRHASDREIERLAEEVQDDEGLGSADEDDNVDSINVRHINLASFLTSFTNSLTSCSLSISLSQTSECSCSQSRSPSPEPAPQSVRAPLRKRKSSGDDGIDEVRPVNVHSLSHLIHIQAETRSQRRARLDEHSPLFDFSWESPSASNLLEHAGSSAEPNLPSMQMFRNALEGVKKVDRKAVYHLCMLSVVF